ncbi:MAG: hypothetical protein ABH852_06505 [Methanobacteriota archaeon]
MDVLSMVSRKILQRISSGEISDAQGLSRGKIEACREFGLANPPRNSELLAFATAEEKKMALKMLRLKPVRSISGVSIITVMPKPIPAR